MISRIIRNGGYKVFLEQIIVFLSGIVLIKILSSKLSISEYGGYQTFISYVSMGVYFGSFGLEQLFMSKYPAINLDNEKLEFVTQIWKVKMMTLFPIVALVLLISPEGINIYMLAIAVTLESILSFFVQGFSVGLGKRAELSNLNIYRKLLFLCSFPFFSNILTVLCIFVAIQVILLSFFCFKFSSELKFSMDARGILEASDIRFAFASFIGKVGFFAREYSADLLIISLLIGNDYVAKYSALILLPSTLRKFAFTRTFQSIMSSDFIKKRSLDLDTYKSSFRLYHEGSFLLTVALIFPFFILSTFLLNLVYPQEYYEEIIYLIPLALMNTILSAFGDGLMYRMIIERRQKAIKFNGILSLLNLLTSVIAASVAFDLVIVSTLFITSVSVIYLYSQNRVFFGKSIERLFFLVVLAGVLISLVSALVIKVSIVVLVITLIFLRLSFRRNEYINMWR